MWFKICYCAHITESQETYCSGVCVFYHCHSFSFVPPVMQVKWIRVKLIKCNYTVLNVRQKDKTV